jgi:hypothetical protein
MDHDLRVTLHNVINQFPIEITSRVANSTVNLLSNLLTLWKLWDGEYGSTSAMTRLSETLDFVDHFGEQLVETLTHQSAMPAPTEGYHKPKVSSL